MLFSSIDKKQIGKDRLHLYQIYMTMFQDIVKYGFALLDSDNGKVIGIDSLSRKTRASHKFFCPHCHGEMYPTFGPIQMPHFRHIGEKCKPDKYLHSLAEKIFEEEYLNCLENGTPFILEIHSPVVCSYECLNKQNDICRIYQNTKILDLTKAFTKIEKESHVKFDDHFRIPDILLTSEHDAKNIHLWVEIWVKHETEEKKRTEGSVLEIKISSEDDLKPIREHRIVVSGKVSQARIFNEHFPGKSILKKDLHDTSTCLDQEICPPACAYKKNLVKRKIAVKRNHAPQYDIPPIDLAKTEWVDLGLPSGVLWAKEDEDVPVPISIAIQSYPDNLPSDSDAEELKECCNRHFDPIKKEMIFTGANGNSISFKCTEKYTSYWLNEYVSKYNKDYGKCFNLIPYENSFYINNKDSIKLLHIHLVYRHKK